MPSNTPINMAERSKKTLVFRPNTSLDRIESLIEPIRDILAKQAKSPRSLKLLAAMNSNGYAAALNSIFSQSFGAVQFRAVLKEFFKVLPSKSEFINLSDDETGFQFLVFFARQLQALSDEQIILEALKNEQ